MLSAERNELQQLNYKPLVMTWREDSEYQAKAPVADQDEGNSWMELYPAPFLTGFSVTSAAYREFIRKSRLNEVVEGLLEVLDVNNSDALHSVAAQIKQIIHSFPYPQNLRQQIQAAYERLGSGPVVVWDVTYPNEVFDASLRARQQVFSYVEGLGKVLAAIKSCWASLYYVEAILRLETSGLRHQDTGVAVLMQQI